MIDDDAKAIIRTERDALMEARPYVQAMTEKYDALLLGVRTDKASVTLEHVDGAIAEADEVLS